MPRIIAIRGIFVFTTIKYAREAALTQKVRIPSSLQKAIFYIKYRFFYFKSIRIETQNARKYSICRAFFYFIITKNAEILKNKKRKSWQSKISNKTATIRLVKLCISTC